MKNHRLLFVALTLCIFSIASGQSLTDSVAIHFRQSKTALDSTYLGNNEAFKHIREMVETYHHPDSDFVLLDVKVIGGASPEGSVKFNNWLSAQRATRVYDYMDARMMLPGRVTRRTELGRDWHGLRDKVQADASVPYREDVLATLDDIIAKIDSGEKDNDENLQKLKRLHSGMPYLYVYRHIFPVLRQGDVVLTFGHPFRTVPPETVLLSVTPFPEPSLCDIDIPEQKEDKPFYMALKSNMIADVLALPEIGAEFYLGKNFSAVGNWMYGWWDNDGKHKYWRAYGGDLAVRWWFGRAAHNKPLTGHHIGVYGGVVTYDFEFGGKGHMGGRPGHSLWDRCMHYMGVEYGYSLPIARRWNIDFTLGLGYMGGKVVEYEPCEACGHCYRWESTKQKHWYGPTKLEVSVVWLIGHGNYNKK